jgi:hypothetical protein
MTRSDPSSGNSQIKHYQARAAAHVYSTARNVLPGWTTNYFLSDSHVPAANTVDDNKTTCPVDQSHNQRFVAFDNLRGRDVLVTATECQFTLFNVCHGGLELHELCGYSCDGEVVFAKVPPPLILSD